MKTCPLRILTRGIPAAASGSSSAVSPGPAAPGAESGCLEAPLDTH
jgi:hypothetical protein